MSHQPFESWMLEKRAPEHKERQLLEDHLKICSECHQLHAGLAGFEKQFQFSKGITTPPGFSERWRIKFSQRKIELEHKQSHTFTWIILVSAMISFAFLAYYLVSSYTPADLMIRLAKLGVDGVNAFFEFRQILEPIASLPMALPLIIVVSIMSLIGVAFLSSVWFTIVWRYAKKGAI